MISAWARLIVPVGSCATECPGHDRVQLLLLGLLVREQLVDEKVVDVAHERDRLVGGWFGEPVGGVAHPVDVDPQDGVFVDEPAGQRGVGAEGPGGRSRPGVSTRSALTMTATSMSSCTSAPAVGGSHRPRR